MTNSLAVSIAGRPIGPGHPPYVVAEMSANHLGDFTRAQRIIRMAAEAGADAVKIQTYTAETITLNHDGPGFVIEGGLWDGRRLFDLYRQAHTPWDWHPALFETAAEAGITLFSSPFDATAIDLLKSLEAPAYKIASFECIDTPLIAAAAATGKPLIISTGMAGPGEIAAAVTAARAAGEGGLILLHCVSGYPTPIGDCHLRTLPNLAQTFGVVAGLSDHTPGSAVAVAAVALGACFIEKHVTLDRAEGGPDAPFSLEPDELARLIADVRTAWEALGEVNYTLKDSEAVMAPYRRSLYASADIAAGEPLTPANVRSIRPGGGLPPGELPRVLGQRARAPIAFGTPLAWHLIEP